MKVSNSIFLLKTFTFIFSIIVFTGCDPNSTGSNETQQLDNDNDPTAIEVEEALNPQLVDRTNEMNEKGEFVVIREFYQSNAEKLREEFNLKTDNDSATTQMNSNFLGAGEWKSWGEYQYRILYFTEGGSLKAKPQLKNSKNEEMKFSSHTIDSLKLSSLWTVIQQNSNAISNSFK